jgi:hypothetical protein
MGTYHVVPGRHNGLHVKVAREERHDPVRYNFAVLDKNTPEVPNDSRIVPDFEPRANSNLITPASDYLPQALVKYDGGQRSDEAFELARRTKGRNEFRESVIA